MAANQLGGNLMSLISTSLRFFEILIVFEEGRGGGLSSLKEWAPVNSLMRLNSNFYFFC